MVIDDIFKDKKYKAMFKSFASGMQWMHLRSFRVDFASAVEDYQAILDMVIKHVGTGEAAELAALEFRRRTAELIVSTAHDKKQPFDVCQRCWNDLLQLGFTDIDARCMYSWFFVDSCRQHGQVDIGLGVLDPLLAELNEMMSAPKAPRALKKFCKYQLENLGKLRAELEALRG